MGKTVRELVQAGSRQLSCGDSRGSSNGWFAGALTRGIGNRLVPAVVCSSRGELGAGRQCLMVRGFDGPRAVLVQPRRPRLAARNGVPVTRLGQRVAGVIVRGIEFGG